MRFFIWDESVNLGSWVEKKANLLAVHEDVKDETLDTASLDLLADDREEPYPARAYCKITESGNQYYYRLATDSVSVFSLSPKTYKHSLSLVQTTRDLSHRILPNMVITKPREKESGAYFATSNTINLAYFMNYPTSEAGGILNYYKGFFSDDYIYNADFTSVSSRYGAKSGGSRYWCEPFACTPNEKAGKAVLRLKFTAVKISGQSQDKSLSGEMVTMKRAPAYPSWLQPYIAVYHTTTNVSATTSDSEIENQVELFRKDLTSKTWGGDYLEIALTDSDVAKINSYDDGYVYADLKTSVVGTLPAELDDTASGSETKVEKAQLYDRLFTDISEYDENGYQKIILSMKLAITYKRAFLLDTLQRILDRAQSKYSQGNKTPLFALPTSGGDYEVLSSVESPEFTFTNQTVFEAVSQVLETIDALPAFKVTEGGTGKVTETLSIDYLNKRGAKVGKTKFAGYTAGISENKYVNGIVTNYQKAESIRHFPCFFKGNGDYAPVRVKDYGVPELRDFAMVMDKPIKYINRLEVKTSVQFKGVWKNSSTGQYDLLEYSTNVPIDLSTYVFEESVYSSALSDRGDYESTNRNVRLQLNCLKFSKGSKSIDLGNKVTTAWNQTYLTFWNCWKDSYYRAFGMVAQNSKGDVTGGALDSTIGVSFPEEADYSSIRFRCEYASDLDGRLRVETPFSKASGEMNASAGGASIDLGKLGLNMLGVSMRTGVPTLTCNQTISSWEQRILKGQVLKKDGYDWIANKCDYQIIGDGIIKGTIEFTRDFNGMSKRIAIDQNKRFSNISDSIVAKCETNIMNYCYAYGSLSNIAEIGSLALMNTTPINTKNLCLLMNKALGTSYAGDRLDVDFARYYLEPSTSGVRDIYMPLAVYGAGNCLCFEASFDDPISAGIRMDVTTKDNGKWWYGFQTAIKAKQYFGKDVKCADDQGYAETISIDYVDGDGATFPDTFPYIPDGSSKKAGTLSNLKFRKMPNEILAVNYEIAFLSYYHGNQEVFFGKAFFDSFKGERRSDGCRLWFSEKESDVYTAFDTKAKGRRIPSPVTITFKQATGVPNEWVMCFEIIKEALPIIPAVYFAFALATEDGEVIMACNYAQLEDRQDLMPYLHFQMRSKRLE